MSENPAAPREYATAERCYITEYVNRPSFPGVSVAQARVLPGVTTALHTVTVEEWYVIRSGAGLMHVGGREPFPVAPGDSVRIPPGCEQKITNTGTADLLFFCICTPRFTPPCYRSLE